MSCTYLSLALGACLAEAVHPAVSGLWPWPTGKVAASGSDLQVSSAFKFHALAECAPLSAAFDRYRTLLGLAQLASTKEPLPISLDSCTVEVVNWTTCTRAPRLEDDESYVLDLKAPHAYLRADTFTGALRGLESLSQLFDCNDNVCRVHASSISIEDKPRFSWRGVMLDTARHFLPTATVLKMLDAMAYNKLNVLHWHITDDQSFPLRTLVYPKLVHGAYSAEATYSHDDVQAVVKAAADRGIRVVPELDSPGHALSWSAGYPQLAVPECHTLDPTKEATYTMLLEVFAEVARLFPDEYVHLGCDEVSFSCWNSSSQIATWMEQNKIPRTDLGFKHLTARYIGRLQQQVKSAGKTPVVWQEAMDHYGESTANPTPPAPELDPDMVVEQWLAPTWNWANLSSIVEPGYKGRNVSWPSGFRALVTNGWYLDSTAVNSWDQVYMMEPLTNASCIYNDSFPEGHCTCQCTEGPWRDGKCYCYDLRRSHFAEKVLGGEAPLWGEHIDASNLFPRAFPRLSAVAERLWSSMDLNNVTEASSRLDKQRCRMLRRGVEVTPLGPGFCSDSAKVGGFYV